VEGLDGLACFSSMLAEDPLNWVESDSWDQSSCVAEALHDHGCFSLGVAADPFHSADLERVDPVAASEAAVEQVSYLRNDRNCEDHVSFVAEVPGLL